MELWDLLHKKKYKMVQGAMIHAYNPENVDSTSRTSWLLHAVSVTGVCKMENHRKFLKELRLMFWKQDLVVVKESKDISREYEKMPTPKEPAPVAIDYDVWARPGFKPSLCKWLECMLLSTGLKKQALVKKQAEQLVKNLPAMQETWVQSLSWEDPLEKGMATHSSILAWRIAWTV